MKLITTCTRELFVDMQRKKARAIHYIIQYLYVLKSSHSHCYNIMSTTLCASTQLIFMHGTP